jgi:predicted  nucleic acid-binding Zn-ribbon protein
MKGFNLSLLDIASFVFSTPAWLYSVYTWLRHDKNLARSLWDWPFSILKFAYKNPLKVIVAVAVIFMAWKIFSQPQAEINPLEGVKNSIVKIQDKVGAIDGWVDGSQRDWSREVENVQYYENYLQVFSKPPASSDLPKNRKKLEKLNSEYRNTSSFVHTLRNKLSQVKGEIAKKNGALEDSKVQLSSVKLQLKAECEKLEASQQSNSCLSLSGAISQIDKEVSNLLSSISSINSELDLVEKKVNIPRGVFAEWERKIIELRAAFTPFDPELVSTWFKETEDLMVKVNQFIPILKKDNVELERRLAGYEREFNQFLSSHNVIKSSFMKQELSGGKQRIDVLLKQARSYNDNLSNLRNKINTFSSNLDATERRVIENADRVEYLKNGLTGLTAEGYHLSLTIPKENQSLKQKVRELKENKIDPLRSGFKELEKEFKGIAYKLDKKKANWSFGIGQIGNSVDHLESKNQKLLRSLEFKIFLSQAMIIFVIFVTISALVLYVTVIRRANINKRLGELSHQFPNLMSTVTNTGEFMMVRLAAVKFIYNEQSFLTVPNIALIKETVRKLEKSKSRDDIRIASELRRVADALELRLTEQRKFR